MLNAASRTTSVPTPRDSRVLLLSQRRMHAPLWHATQHELEDVVSRIDDVELLSPSREPDNVLSELSRRTLNPLNRRLRRPRTTPPWPVPVMRTTSVVGEHDLFFAVFHHSHELLHLRRLVGWRERCRFAACLLIEMWTPDLETDGDYLQHLRDFDVVYVANPALVPGLLALGVRAARYLPTATDTLLFGPATPAPARLLDCYNYGRASQVTHAALLHLVESRGLTYLYDSTAGGRIADPTHRRLIANMLQRTRFFFAYCINDSPERRRRTGGDEAISTRYFEATAGGAVVLGSRPRAEEFAELFDWPDVVLPVPYECADVGDVLDELDRDPDRLSRIRSDNVRNNLLRHDWSHRWSVVLADAGLAPANELQERQELLRERGHAVAEDGLSTQGLAAAQPAQLR